MATRRAVCFALILCVAHIHIALADQPVSNGAKTALDRCILLTAEQYATQSCEPAASIYEATFGACSDDVNTFKRMSRTELSKFSYEEQENMINTVLGYYKPYVFNTVIKSRIKAHKECK